MLASTRHLELAIAAAAMLAGAEAQVGLYAFGGGEPGNLSTWQNDQANATTRGFFRNTLRTLDRSLLASPRSRPKSSIRAARSSSRSSTSN